MPDAIVRLKPGREKPVLHGHPWIFSGAIGSWSQTSPPPGPVDIVAANGDWLARGLAHPDCNLAVRILTRNPDERLDDVFFAHRLDRALDLRDDTFGPIGSSPDPDAYRLVFAEADGLSGLIIDRYADLASIHVGSRALAPFLPALLDYFTAVTGIRALHVAADRDAAEREQVDPDAIARLSRGNLGARHVLEGGFRYLVDVAAGQKTGFYVDQRDNRRRVAAYARGRSVLSAYCYTGSFELHAAAAGATRITGLDISRDAVERAREHHRANGLTTPIHYEIADVPVALRKFRDAARSFDLIILDPPRFVSSAAQKDKGMRAYKDINLLALKLLTRDGILATFSCAGLVSADDLRMTLAWAAVDAGREVQILETLGQPADHPIRLSFPESDYLHGLICRVL